MAVLIPKLSNSARTDVDTDNYLTEYGPTLFYTILQALRRGFCGVEFLGTLFVEPQPSALNTDFDNHLTHLNLTKQGLRKLLAQNLCMSAYCSATHQHNTWVEEFQIPAGFEVIAQDQVLKFQRISHYIIKDVQAYSKELLPQDILNYIIKTRRELTSVCHEMREKHKASPSTGSIRGPVAGGVTLAVAGSTNLSLSTLQGKQAIDALEAFIANKSGTPIPDNLGPKNGVNSYSDPKLIIEHLEDMYRMYIIQPIEDLLDNDEGDNCLKEYQASTGANQVNLFRIDFQDQLTCSIDIPSQFPPKLSGTNLVKFDDFLDAMQKRRVDHGLHTCTKKNKFKKALTV